MKRAFIALGLLVLLAAPAGAGSLGLHASWWDADGADDDVGAGILLDFALGRAVDLEFRGTFFDDQSVVVGSELVPFRASAVDLGAAYNFNRSGGNLTPYVGGGFSYYFLDADKDSQGRIEDEAGWYALIGVEVPVTQNWMCYVEGMWREAEGKLRGDDLGFGADVDFGFDMKGPTVNLGIALHW